ncbi:MAG: hypothetical protein LIP28_04950 [Deltaproteobacteria bacterium]|nr:hypothetical protein [Deltaproteobacteria bacterium]
MEKPAISPPYHEKGKTLDIFSGSPVIQVCGQTAVKGTFFMQHVYPTSWRSFTSGTVYFYGFYFYGFSTACGRECAA